jgi:hypothetical protein
MEARMNRRLSALAIAGEAREIRLRETLALVWEAVKTSGEKTGERISASDSRIAALAEARKEKENWDFEQWEQLAEQMNARKREIEEIRKGMSALA